MQNKRIELFSGYAAAQGRDAALMYGLFTAHVGGVFDAAGITVGSRFEMTYTGEKGAAKLVLISHSGASRWAPLDADSEMQNGEGSYKAVYSYETIIKTFGSNFARLDEIRPVCTTESKVTCNSIVFIPGEGPVADNTDGKWDKPSEGIAFLGDSITQNVFYNEGDFNSLLGRNDCVNYGIGAQNSRHLLKRIHELAERNYRMLVIWCGINDIGAGITDNETFENVRGIIECMRKSNPGMTFAIISILPTTKAFYEHEQDRISARNRLLSSYAAENTDVTYVDCYSDFIGEDGYCKDGLTLDGLHPNGKGYELVKNRLLEVIK